MTNALNPNQSTPISGLGTWQVTIVTAGLYRCSVQCTIPYQASGSSNNSTSTTGQSGLSIEIEQNSTNLITVGAAANNPTPTQPTLGCSALIQAAANDVISIILTSANAVDAYPNAVKGIINLYAGE